MKLVKEISPGKIYTLWEILNICLKNPDTELSISDIHTTLISLGTIPNPEIVSSSINMGIALRILSIESRCVEISKVQYDIIIGLISKEYGLLDFIRHVLYYIISDEKPSWVLWFDFDTDVFCEYIPQRWIDLLHSANLLNYNEPNVLDWWMRVSSKLNEFNDETKALTGTIGEKLTINFEVNRLSENGFNHPLHLVKWVAQVRDDFGYDILSRNSGLLDRIGSQEKILIEVKSTEIKDPSKFIFYVSKNEWRVSNENPKSFLYYFWIGVDRRNGKADFGPFIVNASDLFTYFPFDVHEDCEWTECRFTIDLTIIKLQFDPRNK
jgi:hypothetical protein